MKFISILDCYQTLSALFTRRMPFIAAEKLYDFMLDLEAQARKYSALHDRILNQYGVPDTEDESKYTIPAKNAREFQDEMAQLNVLEYNREKQTIPIIERITPKELMFLREFFDFEGCDHQTESGESE